MNEQPPIKLRGYVDELKAQIEWLSDRNAQYAAELAEARQDNELLKAQVKDLQGISDAPEQI